MTVAKPSEPGSIRLAIGTPLRTPARNEATVGVVEADQSTADEWPVGAVSGVTRWAGGSFRNRNGVTPQTEGDRRKRGPTEQKLDPLLTPSW